MDEVKIPRFTIPTTRNWDEWYQLIQDELQKHIEIVAGQISRLETLQKTMHKDDNYSMFVGGLSSIFTPSKHQYRKR